MAKLSTHSKNTAPSTAELADREFERIDANKVVIRERASYALIHFG